MSVVLCQKCGAALPLPDPYGMATCGYCRLSQQSTSTTLPVAYRHADSDALASSPAGDAARIAMTDEAVLGLLRQHFSGVESTYVCPSIPGKKELGARAMHARHLPSDERVLTLYDDTVFGTGDEGFLVTSQRLCWKNAGDRAHMIEWRHVDPDRVYADKRRLVLGTQAIVITGDDSVIDACEQAFLVLAFSARTASTVARSGIALSPSAGRSGFAAVSPSGRPGTLPLAQSGFRPPHDTRPSNRPTFRPSHPPTLESAIAPAPATPRRAAGADAHAAHAANATPPPPHGVSFDSYLVHAASQRAPSFACWHCRTPLYWNTPQCARCSALPSPQGWLRTA